MTRAEVRSPILPNSHYRGFSAEQLEIQLTSLEILLDIAERRGNARAAFSRIALEYAHIQKESLRGLDSAELAAVYARVQAIEQRLARLDGGANSPETIG